MVWYLSCTCTASCDCTSLPCSEAVKLVCTSSVQGHSGVGTFHPFPVWWHSSPQLSSSAKFLFGVSANLIMLLGFSQVTESFSYGRIWEQERVSIPSPPLGHICKNSFCITVATRKLELYELFLLPRMNPKILNKIIFFRILQFGRWWY